MKFGYFGLVEGQPEVEEFWQKSMADRDTGYPMILTRRFEKNCPVVLSVNTPQGLTVFDFGVVLGIKDAGDFYLVRTNRCCLIVRETDERPKGTIKFNLQGVRSTFADEFIVK